MLIDAHAPEAIWALLYILFGIAAPLVLIACFVNPKIKTECERLNPAMCVTDRFPIPVLCQLLVIGFTAFGLIFASCYHWVIPVFGTVVEGRQGAVIISALVFCLVVLLLGLYGQRPWASWGTVIFWGCCAISSVVSLQKTDWMEIVNAGLPQAVLAQHDYVGAYIVTPAMPIIGLGSGLYMPFFFALGSSVYVLHLGLQLARRKKRQLQ